MLRRKERFGMQTGIDKIPGIASMPDRATEERKKYAEEQKNNEGYR
jgi:hypothetical protein